MNGKYRVELANKIKNGRSVGNLYGVMWRGDDGRFSWALEPQEDKHTAYRTMYDLVQDRIDLEHSSSIV